MPPCSTIVERLLTLIRCFRHVWALCLLASITPVNAQRPADTIPLLSDQFLTEMQPQLRPARDYIPLRIGDKWTFRIGNGSASADSAATLRVASMNTIGEADVYCIERRLNSKSNVTKECYSVGESGVYIHHMLQSDFDPAIPILKSPVVLENTYSASTKVGGNDLRFSITVREDRVQVPAGDFPALHVAVSTNTRYKFGYLLAPHIGFVKMSLMHGPTTLNLDLEKFETGTLE